MMSFRMKNKTILIAGIIVLLSCILSGASYAATWLSAISSGVDAPTRIAVDDAGNIYVTGSGRLLKFDRKGTLQHTMTGLQRPLGVAVDGSGRIYVGQSQKSAGSLGSTGWVAVYNTDFTPAFQLGKGKGEFTIPESIAVTKSGKVYVADLQTNTIKVYNADGTPALSFGGPGDGNGKFSDPCGLAVDEAAGELYVLDHHARMDSSGSGMSAGVRVQVFDLLAGTYKRGFGEWGTGPGKIHTPQDIALDASGKVYVTDRYQKNVQVFDSAGAYLETIADAAHPLAAPMGIAIGKDNRIFIASTGGNSVEVFGLAGYTTLAAAPASLAFTVVQGAGNPAAQAVTISNSGTGSLDWSAAAAPGWITVTPAIGAAAPSSSLSIGVNAAGLSMGTYNGTVAVTAASGAIETVSVQLAVTPPPAVLSVTPASLAFTAQQNGSTPPAKTIAISNLGGGVMTWTASKSQPWLSLSAISGTAPSSIEASINTPLSVGTYTDTVVINAYGSQARVNVTVAVGNTGTVTITTNLSQAGFTVTGPAPSTTAITGTGTLWKNENMAPGDYTVTYDHVSGYKKPAPRSITVATGQETAITGDYLKKTAATHIVALSGGATNRKVTVMTVSGEATTSFKPFTYPQLGTQVAAGDLDGSGTDKIAVANNQRSVRVFSADGAQLAAFALPLGFKNSNIVVSDLDNDGKAEVVLGAVVDRIGKPDIRVVKLLAYGSGKLEEKASLFTEEKNGMFRIALGDVNGDLKQELVVADLSGIRTFTIEGGVPGQLWSIQGAFKVVPNVSTGDLDDDGNAEVVLSLSGMVQVLKGTGEPTGVVISTPVAALKPAPASIACGDTDGDGADEIAVGTAAGIKTVPTVQLMEGAGTAIGAAITIKDGGNGANVSLGSF